MQLQSSCSQHCHNGKSSRWTAPSCPQQALKLRARSSIRPATTTRTPLHPVPLAGLRSLSSGRTTNTVAAAASSGGNAVGSSPRLQRVLAKIEELNRHDPRTTKVEGGEVVAYGVAYARWLTSWVRKLTADGQPPLSEELLIVAAGQHVQRWTSPRESYPEGKAGYLKWREDLKKHHARVVTGIMEQEGYDDQSRKQVESIILKRAKTPEGQVVEDALCLVFLEHQFTDLINKEGADKMVGIVKKTWGKMGEKGRQAALKLSLSPAELDVVQRALAA